MKALKAVIVEDEALGIRNLQEKLKRNCPQVEVIGICQTSQAAIQEIPQLMPDLVFLDINIDNLNGFDVLDRLKYISFEVIFTTVYDQYVINAIRANALDYLLKPINENDLMNAVMRAWEKTKQASSRSTRIPIPALHGFVFIDVDEIIHVQANDNRTVFHLFNKKKIQASRNLGQIEEQLSGFDFMRIHRSHLINRHYLEEFSKVDGGFVIMSNGDRLKVAKNRFKLFS